MFEGGMKNPTGGLQDKSKELTKKQTNKKIVEKKRKNGKKIRKSRKSAFEK